MYPPLHPHAFVFPVLLLSLSLSPSLSLSLSLSLSHTPSHSLSLSLHLSHSLTLSFSLPPYLFLFLSLSVPVPLSLSLSFCTSLVRMLLRVAQSVSKFPLHVVPILTSTGWSHIIIFCEGFTISKFISNYSKFFFLFILFLTSDDL